MEDRRNMDIYFKRYNIIMHCVYISKCTYNSRYIDLNAQELEEYQDKKLDRGFLEKVNFKTG